MLVLNKWAQAEDGVQFCALTENPLIRFYSWTSIMNGFIEF